MHEHGESICTGIANPGCSLFLVTFGAQGGCEDIDLIRQAHLQEQVLLLTLLSIFVSLSGDLQEFAANDPASYGVPCFLLVIVFLWSPAQTPVHYNSFVIALGWDPVSSCVMISEAHTCALSRWLCLCSDQLFSIQSTPTTLPRGLHTPLPSPALHKSLNSKGGTTENCHFHHKGPSAQLCLCAEGEKAFGELGWVGSATNTALAATREFLLNSRLGAWGSDTQHCLCSAPHNLLFSQVTRALHRCTLV